MSRKNERKEKKINFNEFRRSPQGTELLEDKNAVRQKYTTKDYGKSNGVSIKTLTIMSLLIVSVGLNVGIWNERYSEGMLYGYDSGNLDGYTDGFIKGEKSGHSSGYVDGYERGFSKGEVSGLDDGYNEGYVVGLDKGRETGYITGYDEGKIEGLDEGYIKGVEDGVGKGYNIRDPTYKEAINFMKSDKTNEIKYSDNFVCRHFVAIFKQNAFEAGYRCLYVGIDYPRQTGHAIIGFETTDKGLIFIEPQHDKVVTVKIGESYSELNNFIRGGDDTIIDFILIP